MMKEATSTVRLPLMCSCTGIKIFWLGTASSMNQTTTSICFVQITGIAYLQYLILSHPSHYESHCFIFFGTNTHRFFYSSQRPYSFFGMTPTPAVPRRSNGFLGYLNYPPEIMKIYEHLFIDNSHILVFLCSSHPRLRQINLRRWSRRAPITQI